MARYIFRFFGSCNGLLFLTKPIFLQKYLSYQYMRLFKTFVMFLDHIEKIVYTRLLHPQHLGGIWIGQEQVV